MKGMHLCLVIKYAWDEHSPRHLLQVPPDWAKHLEGDYGLCSRDFLSRRYAGW